jgi:hypothetical protein
VQDLHGLSRSPMSGRGCARTGPRAALLWRSLTVTDDGAAEAHAGGIDILTVRDGRISRAWSLAGRLDFSD